MTISSEDRRAGPYDGNDTATSFAFDFKVFAKENIQVLRTDTDGVEHVLVLDSDYSVTLNGDQDADPGGSVTYPISGDPLPLGESLTVLGALEYTQTADITNQGGFYPQVVENALDRNTILIQQLKEITDRALTLPASAPTSTSTQLPQPESNALIGWNENADALQNVDIGTLATVVAYGTANADVFTGDGVTTQFQLADNPGALANLDVSIGGVTQLPGTDYTWGGGDILTTTSPVPNGEKLLVRYMQALPFGTASAANIVFEDWDLETLLRKGVALDFYNTLRLYDGAATNVFLRGRAANGDGGGGIFYRDSSDLVSADNDGTILVDSLGRRWKRQYAGLPFAEWFGAVGDYNGTTGTNNLTPITNALNAHKCIGLGQGRFYIGGKLDMPLGGSIYGAGKTRTAIVVDKESDGVQVGMYAVLSDLRIVGIPGGSTTTKKLLMLGAGTGPDLVGDVWSARSHFRSVLIGGPQVEHGDWTNGNWEGYGAYGEDNFLASFVDCYFHQCRYGWWSFGYSPWGPYAVNNALAFVNCEFYSCAIGQYIENPQGVSWVGCTWEGNYGAGLWVISPRGCHLDGYYFEANNKIAGAPAGWAALTPIKAECLVTLPGALTDIGTSISIREGLLVKLAGTNSDYGIYADKTRFVHIEGANCGANAWPIAAIFTGNNITQANVSRCFVGAGSYSFGVTTQTDAVISGATVRPNFTAWLPTIEGSSTAGVGTYGFQQGRWQKRGSVVEFTLRVSITAHTGTGDMRIKLPFAARASGGGEFWTVNVCAQNLTFAGQLSGRISGGNDYVTLFTQSSGAAFAGVAMDTVCDLAVTGWYET